MFNMSSYSHFFFSLLEPKTPGELIGWQPPTSIVVVRRPHFQKEIPLQPASKALLNSVLLDLHETWKITIICIKSRASSKKVRSDQKWYSCVPLIVKNGHNQRFEQRSFIIFCWIFMKLVDINDMDKISEKFENGPDRINSSSVLSPWLSKWPLLTM